MILLLLAFGSTLAWAQDIGLPLTVMGKAPSGLPVLPARSAIESAPPDPLAACPTDSIVGKSPQDVADLVRACTDATRCVCV